MQMELGQSSLNVESSETQLEIIRELMLTSFDRGEWLTLAEIALQTEFGEASISAQLRHLRKPRHGRYRVDKRRRQLDSSKMSSEECTSAASGLWEYQVLPSGLGSRIRNMRCGYEPQPAQICGEVK